LSQYQKDLDHGDDEATGDGVRVHGGFDGGKHDRDGSKHLDRGGLGHDGRQHDVWVLDEYG
jgi:hypothetical protein